MQFPSKAMNGLNTGLLIYLQVRFEYDYKSKLNTYSTKEV